MNVSVVWTRQQSDHLQPIWLSLSLQQYHQKIFAPHNNLCVHSDNRLHCNISHITAPSLRLLSLDFTFCTNATFNTDEELILQNSVASGPKHRLADYLPRRLEWGLVGWHWMACTQLADLMDQWGCRSSEDWTIRSRGLLKVCRYGVYDHSSSNDLTESCKQHILH